jgi:hypothetical protein
LWAACATSRTRRRLSQTTACRKRVWWQVSANEFPISKLFLKRNNNNVKYLGLEPAAQLVAENPGAVHVAGHVHYDKHHEKRNFNLFFLLI